MQRESSERVHGPYKHRNQYRVIVVSGDGARVTHACASEAEARKLVRALTEEIEGRTVSAAVDLYVEHLRAGGRRETTLATVGFRLKGLLQTTGRDRAISTLTTSVARAMFADRCDEIASSETQRGELATASAFAAWCKTRGWIHSDPFAGLAPCGKAPAEKPQLRITEARAFLEAALAEESHEGLAAALALLLGLRASEVTKRVVRDVDDGARVLWVDRAKTAAGSRVLEIPTVLRERMAAWCKGRSGGEALWGDVDRHWLGRHVRRLCRVAHVTLVSPHGLRRSWSSISATTQPVEHVAAALGHTSASITRRHYLAPGAEQVGQGRAMLRVIEGGQRG